MVELVPAGRSPEALAKEFEPSGQTIRNWVIQAERDEGVRRDGPSRPEQEELRRLRRENKQLRIERGSWQKPRLGSLARPTRGPARLRVHESAPGQLSGVHDVPRAEGFPQRLLRRVETPAVGSHSGRCGAQSARRADPPTLPGHLRGAEDSGRLAEEGRGVSRKRIARLMLELGVRGVCGRRRISTTRRSLQGRVASDEAAPVGGGPSQPPFR